MVGDLYDATSTHFSQMFNTPGKSTFFTLDDDVLRATSKKNQKLGYPLTRIPNRKIGINVDGIGDPVTGLFLGGIVNVFELTKAHVMDRILLRNSKFSTIDALNENPDL